MSLRIKYLFTLYFFIACKINAQSYASNSRITINENKDWLFVKDSAKAFDVSKNNFAKWQRINLPHTWNAADVSDDIPGYYRGIGWYKKNIVINAPLKNKQLFLYFEGINQEAEVFVNGKKAGSHIGGYTAFCVPVSSLLNFNGSTNEILVKVDNSYNENIAPLSADFTFYGGIYRSVSLIATNAVHFSVLDNASKSIFISTPAVDETNAVINIKGSFTNAGSSTKKVYISTVITDRQNKQVNDIVTSTAIGANEEKTFEQEIPNFVQPHLWSPDDPYLYTITTQIKDAATGALLDEIKNPLGLRWFSFDAAKGFFLNGKSCRLIGTSRHQDYKGLGNAVSKELAVQDVALIKKMGGNFLRVSHYPQDPVILEACDRLGILASVEIPVVNEITESEAFYRNCENMLVEMIRQNYDHPSVIIWCYMNEILLRPHFNNDKERQKIYFSAITKLAQALDSLTRKEDPFRYTMIANHGDFNRYNDNKLTTVAMLTGWNLYSGWYGSKLEDFPAYLDKHHEKLPQQPFMVTEYGADADSRIRSMQPIRFDKSVEYATKFHRFYIPEIMKRPFVAGAVVWNLADFNSETRAETMPHMNNKGLLTWDRIPKDPYYLYQAALLKKAFVKITSASWLIRSGIADSTGEFCTQPLQVASNLQSLTLKLNGKEIGNKAVVNNIAEWNVPFINGLNKIEVSGYQNGKVYKDALTVDFKLQPYDLSNKKTAFRQVNILAGSKRYFFDESTQQLWLPDQPYRPGSWGHIGGKPFVIGKGSALPYGTDKNIEGTGNDPVYQTQQEGIDQYLFDVQQGKYELTLHFAELYGGEIKSLAYNLNDSSRAENNTNRIFSVIINGVPFLENFNIAKQYGIATPVSKKTIINVTGAGGIKIIFKAIEGEPVLNAVQLKKLD